MLAVIRDADVQLWDVAARQRLRTLDNQRHRIHCLAFSPDGAMLATGDINRRITLWDLRGSGQVSLTGHAGPVNSVAFSPDGRTLASGSDDHTVRLWHVATAQEVLTLHGHRGPVHAVVFSSQGTVLASGGEASQETGEVFLWLAPQVDAGLSKELPKVGGSGE